MYLLLTGPVGLERGGSREHATRVGRSTDETARGPGRGAGSGGTGRRVDRRHERVGSVGHGPAPPDAGHPHHRHVFTAGEAEALNETVPANTCSATFTVYGNIGGEGFEGGGTGANGGGSGLGGEAEGTATVTGGEPYQIDIGGQGESGGGTNSEGTITNPGGSSQAPGGEGAGGNAGGAVVGDLNGVFAKNGGGGGAASFLFLGTHTPTTSTTPLLVAGGGGGGASNVAGGGGGGASNAADVSEDFTSATGGHGARGGSAAGSAGTPGSNGEPGGPAGANAPGAGGTGDLAGQSGSASPASSGSGDGGVGGIQSSESTNDWLGGGGGGGGGWTGGGASSYLFTNGTTDGANLPNETPLPEGWSVSGGGGGGGGGGANLLSPLVREPSFSGTQATNEGSGSVIYTACTQAATLGVPTPRTWPPRSHSATPPTTGW